MGELALDRKPAGAEEDRADVALAAKGDMDAFERLYRRHAARIHSLSRRMIGDDEDADDATQDVFVRAWRKLGQFRGDSAFGTWLYRLAVNVILGRRQSAGTYRRRFGAEALEPDLATPRPTHELRMDVEQAIQQLPRGAREVFVLHDVEGYTHEEIGALLEVTPGTSKSQLHRARMTMRQYLS